MTFALPSRFRAWRLPTLKSTTCPVLLVLIGCVAACPVSFARDTEAARHALHHLASVPSTRMSTALYTLPDADLLRSDGRKISVRQAIDDGRPTVLNFVYTSCAAICPLSSQVFSQLQKKLGRNRDAVHLVSVSIDPEEDTPQRLTEYAQRFHAGPGWDHYTGTPQASLQVQRAFAAYWGDKMNHAPVTFLRGAPGEPWLRVDGFATADELLADVHHMMAPH